MSKHQNNKQLAKQEAKQSVHQIAVASFQGPIPPPEILARYDEILPGAAERILFMAERQAEHRQNIEKIKASSDSRDSLFGIICGFIIGMFALTIGLIAIIKGNSVAGSILSFSALASLVGVFIYGTRKNKYSNNNYN